MIHNFKTLVGSCDTLPDMSRCSNDANDESFCFVYCSNARNGPSITKKCECPNGICNWTIQGNKIGGLYII